MQCVWIIAKIVALFHVFEVYSLEGPSTKASTGNVNVSGYINIKNETYRATCNCPSHIETLENMIYKNNGLCQPSKLKVRSHNVATSIGRTPIYDTFKRVPLADYVNISETHMSSMDGRHTQKSLFAPGGDLGLFIQALFILFDKQTTSEDMVTNLLRQYVQNMPPNTKFSHSTDEKAVADICKSLQWDAIDLTNINPSYQLRVKELVTKYHGDRYLEFLSRLYRNNPERNRIIIHSINAFYNVLWDKNDPTWEKMKLEVLHGEFKPEYIVEVSVSRGCEIAEKSPMVIPKMEDKQLLIYTEYAANIKRRNIATFMYKSAKTQSRAVDEILLQLDKDAHLLMENFIQGYSRNMPFYNLTFM